MTAQLALAFEAQPMARRAAALQSFHARDESAAEALVGERRAARQNDWILRWFLDRPGARVTPSELWERFEVCRSWPLTSVRRSLTTLTRRGLLRKHPEDRRPGPRGARECTWGLQIGPEMSAGQR